MYDLPATKVTDIMKALQEPDDGLQEFKTQEPASAFIDPLNITNYVGPRAKPGPIGYAILRHMAEVPAIAAILNTRLNQVGNFTHRARSDKDTGFRIVLKDEEAKMTPEQKQVAHNLEEFFLRTGFVRNRKRKDNFNKFMRKLTRDTLTIDEIGLETVAGMNARKHPIAEMYAIDAATIEVVLSAEDTPGAYKNTSMVYEPETERGKTLHPEDIVYVQRVNGLITAEYTEDMLIRGHRNPRTEIEYAHFGYSELEQLVMIVTGIVNGLTYNTSYFTQSSLPQGIMEIVGKYSPENLEAFKRSWTTLTSGTVGRWKVPVVAMEDGQGVKFTPFKQSNRDMEYSQFMEFLFNLACAVYQIDPREVGFKSWDSSGSKTMDNDAPATTMENSKDKGFYPLMQFFEDMFNYDILDRIAPEYRFEWVGLDEDRSSAEWAMEKDQLAAGVLTLRMYWDKHDVDYTRYADQPWIDAPANSVLIGLITNQMQADQQQALQDGQHQNALEASLHQGLQQASLEKNKAQAAMQQQDAAHQNAMEAQMHQGLQQSGLEDKKQAGQQALAQQAHNNTLKQNFAQNAYARGMEGLKQKGAKDLSTHNHQQSLEQMTAQGQQQAGLEKQKLAGQKELAQQAHGNTLKQKFADAGHAKGLESHKQKGQERLAGVAHEQSLEQMMLQTLQNLGVQGNQQKHELTKMDKQGEQQAASAQLQHRLVLRQKMADHGYARGMESQRQKGAQQMAQMKQDSDKKKKDLNKSLDVEPAPYIIEIEISL